MNKPYFDWNKRFKQAVQISLFAHVAIFLVFTVKAYFFDSPAIDVSGAVRVDMVALPDKFDPNETPGAPPEEKAPEQKAEEKPKEKEPAPVAEKPKPKQKEPEAISLEKNKKKQADALKKLKQMAALDEIQKEVDSEKKSKLPGTKDYKFKGNVISPGSELTGVQRMQGEAYLSDIYRIFKSNWQLPEYLRRRQLKAEVLVRIDERGNILANRIAKSSGNPVFDEIVLDAVQKSSPVPPPPEQFVQLSKVEGFLLRFAE